MSSFTPLLWIFIFSAGLFRASLQRKCRTLGWHGSFQILRQMVFLLFPELPLLLPLLAVEFSPGSSHHPRHDRQTSPKTTLYCQNAKLKHPHGLDWLVLLIYIARPPPRIHHAPGLHPISPCPDAASLQPGSIHLLADNFMLPNWPLISHPRSPRLGLPTQR